MACRVDSHDIDNICQRNINKKALVADALGVAAHLDADCAFTSPRDNANVLNIFRSTRDSILSPWSWWFKNRMGLDIVRVVLLFKILANVYTGALELSGQQAWLGLQVVCKISLNGIFCFSWSDKLVEWLRYTPMSYRVLVNSRMVCQWWWICCI